MSSLTIQLFGTVRLSHDGVAGPFRLVHGVQGLMAYLVLHRHRMHCREVLAGVFWSEHPEAQARSCLSTALWRLRQVLEPPPISRGTYLRVCPGGDVGFNDDSDYWLDVATFEEGVRRLQLATDDQQRDLAAAEYALAQYTGDLLDGFYDEWALRERERLRLLHLDGLGRLMHRYSEIGEVDQALGYAGRILELDPLREEIHREVIRLHLRAGRRAHALEQYEACRELLARELDVEPMPETQSLCRELTARSHEPTVADPLPPAGGQLLQPLRRAARSLDHARAQLRRAIRLADASPPKSGA
jgi:DNA-binding SARP family transcriptional activator